MPSSSKSLPGPILTQISVDIWHHRVTMNDVFICNVWAWHEIRYTGLHWNFHNFQVLYYWQTDSYCNTKSNPMEQKVYNDRKCAVWMGFLANKRSIVCKLHSEWKWWLSKSYWNQRKIWRFMSLSTGFTNQTKPATRVATGDTVRVLTQACEGIFHLSQQCSFTVR